MTTDAVIGLAEPADVAGMLELQDQNLPKSGGSLSAAFSREWFVAALSQMPVMVARRDGRVVGYVLSSPFASQAHVPVIQAMLRACPAPDGAYLYGPICVAASERGRGLANRLFAALQAELNDRAAMTFIRCDNTASLKAHAKMGMREVARFEHNGVAYAVVIYESGAGAGCNELRQKP